MKKSTRQHVKAKAQEVCRAMERAEALGREGLLTETRTRELLSATLERITGSGLRTFTTREWLTHFVELKKASRGSKTHLRHEQVKDEFIAFVGSRADLNIAAVTSLDVSGFRDARQRRGLAPATTNLDITILSSAFNAALRAGHITFNPCSTLEPLPDTAGRKHAFTPEQVEALVNVAEGDWRGLILCGFYVGARLGDCANLRWQDVDLLAPVPAVTFTPAKAGKVREGDKKLTVPLHPAFVDYLLALPTPASDDEFLFPSLGGRSISPLSKYFRHLMKRARIEQHVIREKTAGGRSVNALSFHSLRHGFTSLQAAAGVSEERRMALTGHTERDTHKTYTHHELVTLRDAVSVLPHIAVKQS